jgi:hypothetical protein
MPLRVAVAILVGVLGHSANLGIKTFLLIELVQSIHAQRLACRLLEP